MTEFRPSRFQILPPVVKNLLIINVLVFLAQNTFMGRNGGFNFDEVFALHPWQSELFKPWQLLTHVFMHSGKFAQENALDAIAHIGLNMLAVWMFGSILENLWGSRRFLTFYIICGLGAALMHLLFLSWELVPMIKEYDTLAQLHMSGSPDEALYIARFIEKHKIGIQDFDEILQQLRSVEARDGGTLVQSGFDLITTYSRSKLNGATVGASGAVFGILAAFAYLFPNTYLYVYMLIPIKAKWFVLGYAAIEIFLGIRNATNDNVAHWAHIGGALVGLLIVITWNKTNKKTFY